MDDNILKDLIESRNIAGLEKYIADALALNQEMDEGARGRLLLALTRLSLDVQNEIDGEYNEVLKTAIAALQENEKALEKFDEQDELEKVRKALQ
jgi:hypothetical protein